jgi:hypothetical protein
MGHKRDLVHAMMTSQSLASGTMEIADVRRVPTAGLLSGKAAALAGEQPQQGRAGIQAGAQAVTKTIFGGGGYGEGDLPPGMFVPEEVRLKREIGNFKNWMAATGEFTTVENEPQTRETLVKKIKERLDAFLAKAKG